MNVKTALFILGICCLSFVIFFGFLFSEDRREKRELNETYSEIEKDKAELKEDVAAKEQKEIEDYRINPNDVTHPRNIEKEGRIQGAEAVMLEKVGAEAENASSTERFIGEKEERISAAEELMMRMVEARK